MATKAKLYIGATNKSTNSTAARRSDIQSILNTVKNKISNGAVGGTTKTTTPAPGVGSGSASIPVISGTPAPTPVAPTAPTGSGYTVGAGYTPDTSSYAGKTDKNAVAAQAYDRQLEAYQRALQAAYDAQAATNKAEAEKLKGQYDAARSNVYTNNRLSAIGNNERMAALGLAGNLYDYSRSGTSETSRIGQDVAMRRSLAGLDQSENEARSDLALALLMAQKEADANYANKVAEIEAAKIPYLTAAAGNSVFSGGGSGRKYSTSGSGNSSGPSSDDDKSSGNVPSSVHNAAVAAASKYGNNAHLAIKDAVAKEIARLNLSPEDKAASLRHAAELIKKNKE